MKQYVIFVRCINTYVYLLLSFGFTFQVQYNAKEQKPIFITCKGNRYEQLVKLFLQLLCHILNAWKQIHVNM